MANKYLEKIASLGDVARYAGSKLKYAFGVGERDYLAKTLKTNDPKKVMDLGEKFNSFSTRRKILKAKMQGTAPKSHPEYRAELKKARNSFSGDMKDLQERKVDARIIVGGAATGAAVLHKKYKESQPREYQYPETYNY